MKQKTFMPGLSLSLSLSLHKYMSVLEKMLARSLSFSLYIHCEAKRRSLLLGPSLSHPLYSLAVYICFHKRRSRGLSALSNI